MSTDTLVRPAPPVTFEPFGKIGRLRRDMIVTEKLDGTNASVLVSDDGTELWAASRKRWITPGDDNYGFAAWVEEHRDELLTLGPGQHFGEWWGRSIQRGYGLDERRFSLFNVDRWGDAETRPACCDVVPVLLRHGSLDTLLAMDCLADLATEGSMAAPGFMQPEGIVVYHPASRQSFKVTLEGDDAGKGRES